VSPRFSVITPVHNPPEGVLLEMLASVREQTYGDWEHCVVDDGSTAAHVRGVLAEAAAADPRVRVAFRENSGGIVAATNDALELATGEFVAFLDHDDCLRPDALTLVSNAIDAHDDVDYIYTDEDKLNDAGEHYDVFLKPDWSPDRFRLQMYTAHFSVARRSLVEEVGRLRPGFDGSQDWDLVLRVTERARRIGHIREVCYHWRAVSGSVAGDVDAKPWAYDAGRRAVAEHLVRVGFQGRVDDAGPAVGVHRIVPALTDHPLVSIVIPTRGSVRDLWGIPTVLVLNCVKSVLERSTYDNYEFVVVYDSGTPQFVIDQLRELAGDRLQLVEYTHAFNFSEKINLGAVWARGDYLLLLNDDVEVLPIGWRAAWPDRDGVSQWIESMLMYNVRPDVGAVGARMYFSDLRIQHAGVVMHNGLPSHPYRGYQSEYHGYFSNAIIPCDYLALTAACLMTRRDAFEEAGGFSTYFPVNYNDVDFGLKLHRNGYRSVYNPDVELLHFESSTREASVSENEMDALRGRWWSVLQDDPYFHPEFFKWMPDFIVPPTRLDGTLFPT
jgi:glycosyltransferase involved in cell wall biosynthesis